MEEYVKAGKIRAIGLSNFNPHHITDLLKYATVKPVVNQIEIHPYMTQYDVAEFTAKNGIQVQAWGPLGQGTNGVLSDPAIAVIAKNHEKSIAQVILRWHMQRGSVTIPRSTNPAHIAENIAIFDFELTKDDMATINALNKNTRTNPKNDPDNFPW